jgi:hypothetical protein
MRSNDVKRDQGRQQAKKGPFAKKKETSMRRLIAQKMIAGIKVRHQPQDRFRLPSITFLNVIVAHNVTLPPEVVKSYTDHYKFSDYLSYHWTCKQTTHLTCRFHLHCLTPDPQIDEFSFYRLKKLIESQYHDICDQLIAYATSITVDRE